MTHSVHVRRIDEYAVAGKPLGRHVEHDERSREFAAAATPLAGLVSVDHRRSIGPFDQGQVGSCTGNATAGALCTSPFGHRFTATSQHTPLRIYSAATRVDSIPGQYKPDDTGSSGLAAAKAARSFGWVPSYAHAFSLEAALSALVDGPAIFGVNWYDSFDEPDSRAVVGISKGAQVRGGHEIQASELVLAEPGNYSGDDLVGFWQSWGLGYGDHGRFWMKISTLDRLLSEEGDCTVLGAPPGWIR